jgi:hypothetical protein
MSDATASLTLISLLGALAVLIAFLTFVTSRLEQWFATVDELRLTRALVLWTAVLAVATFVGAVVAGLTLSAIRGQLHVMEIDKRPWVAVDAAITDMFRAIHTPDQNALMSLMVDLTLSNTGEAPAVYARIWPSLAITGPPGDPLHFSKLLCDHLRTRPITENTATYTIFPGKTLPPLRNAFETSRRSIEANRTAANGAVLGLVVVGCVDYGFVGRLEHHQTGFAFEVSRKAAEIPGGQCCAIDFFGSDVPAADLRVSLYPFGGFYAD